LGLSTTRRNDELEIALLKGFHLGEIEIQPLRNLAILPNGREVNISKKPMGVLTSLAIHAGEVVEKETILQKVWGVHAGGDEGLKKCIYDLRKSLGDTSSAQQIIETVHGRGYVCQLELKINKTRTTKTLSIDAKVPGKQTDENHMGILDHHLVTAFNFLIHWKFTVGYKEDLELLYRQLNKLEGQLVIKMPKICVFEKLSFANFRVVLGCPNSGEHDAINTLIAAQTMIKGVSEFNREHSDSVIQFGVSGAITSGPIVSTIDIQGKRNLHGPILRTNEKLVAYSSSNLYISESVLEQLDETQSLALKVPDKKLPFTGNSKVYELDIESLPNFQNTNQVSSSAPLIGREAELEILIKCWQNVCEGGCGAVLISGEPGIGKTRLLETFSDDVIRGGPVALSKIGCSSITSNKAFFPLLNFVRRELLGSETSTTKIVRNLEDILMPLAMSLDLSVPLLSKILEIEPGKRYQPLGMSNERQMAMAFELLRDLVLGNRGSNPKLVLLEDAHWADPSTLQVIDSVLGQENLKGVMLVVSSRPTETSKFSQSAFSTQLNLQRLTNQQSLDLLARQLDKHSLSDDGLNSLAKQCDGVPLFLREVARGILLASEENQNSRSTTNLNLDFSLSFRQSLRARIEELGPAGELAKIVAVENSPVNVETLEKVARKFSPHEIEACLQTLVATGLFYRRGISPFHTYTYTHELIREEAYSCLSQEQKVKVHSLYASALASEAYNSSNNNTTESQAYHFRAAGEYNKAIRCLIIAAKNTQEISANLETLRIMELAQSDLFHLPPTEERDQLELSIIITCGPALMALNGYSSQRVVDTYQRAQSLCNSLEDSLEIAPALVGLWAYRVVSSELSIAQDIASRFLAISKDGNDTDMIIEARVIAGVTATHRGYNEEAISHLREVVRLYEPSKHADHCYIYGQDPKMAATAYMGLALWESEYYEQALEQIAISVDVGRQLQHPHSLAFALNMQSRCLLHGNQATLALSVSDELLSISRDNGFPVWEASGMFINQAARYQVTGNEADLAALIDCVDGCKKTGNIAAALDFSTILIKYLIEAGSTDRAHIVLNSAKAEVIRRGDCSEARRLKLLEIQLPKHEIARGAYEASS